MIFLCFWSSLIADRLPAEDSSTDIVFSLHTSLESPSDQLLKEISRVLKPGGTILLYHSQSATVDADKVINLRILWLDTFRCWKEYSLGFSFSQTTSALERKLLLAGFLEAQSLQPKSTSGSDVQSLVVCDCVLIDNLCQLNIHLPFE